MESIQEAQDDVQPQRKSESREAEVDREANRDLPAGWPEVMESPDHAAAAGGCGV